MVAVAVAVQVEMPVSAELLVLFRI